MIEAGEEREVYRAYGAVRQLYRIKEWPKGIYQILIEGGAGTGKTRGVTEWAAWLQDEFPGIRVLFLRRTKESLAESVLDTWENHVLGQGHPAITGTAGPRHRQAYDWPNGSHTVLGGLADEKQATKTFSTQYDLIIVFEAREVPDLAMWQWLARANRNWKIPWQIRLADTNPGAEFHWLNQYFPKAEHGGAFRSIPRKYRERPPFMLTCDNRHVNMIPRPDVVEGLKCPDCGIDVKGASVFRLLSRFQDNPVMWDHEAKTWTPEGREYVEGNLALLTGAPRANLYEHRWAAEEGVIYEEWDPLVHIVEPEDAPKQYDWYFGAFDKGIRHPGCLQVFGVVGDRVWLIYEMYRTEENIDWWAEQVLEVWKKWDLQALVCDHDRDYVYKFNQFLGEKRGRDGEPIARNAVKAILTGIDVMRWALSKRNDGPHFHVVRGYGAGKDPKRTSKMRPACFEEEIGSYIWAKSELGRPQQEKPDPTCSDHSMDTTRYGLMFFFGKDLGEVKARPEYAPMTWGGELDHAEVFDDEDGTPEW